MGESDRKEIIMIVTHRQFRDLLERADLPADDPNHLSREVVQALFFGKNWPLVRRLAARLNGSPDETHQALEVFLADPFTAVPTIPLLSLSAKGELLIRGLNPRTFWNYALEANGWEMCFPEFPTITSATARACVDFGLIPVFCPAGELEQVVGSGHGDKYIFPAWGENLKHPSEIERRPLLGCWILIETRPKPNWNDLVSYGPDDKVAKLLDLQRCSNTDWSTLHDGRLTELAEVWGLPSDTVRLPTVEEMNWCGNLFVLANRALGTNLPNLGSIKNWEWCENNSDRGFRLVFGNSEEGGLSAVHKVWSDGGVGHLAFRILAVLPA
ncbi:MAG: hypothetical protein WC702_01495 [Patescibacteria group bacterium]|jgi:hypothetical protein